VRQVRQIGDPRRNYAKEWRHWRKENGLTQAQLASVLGLTRRTVIGIEGGNHRPSVSSRAKLNELKKRYLEAKS
jgi:DNA-binding XRE family transcriptional regulator